MKKYRKPPLVERALFFRTEIDEEAFRRRSDSWAQQVQEKFPQKETITECEWNLAVSEKEGIPILDTTSSKLTVRNRFWSQSDDKRVIGVQAWSNLMALDLKSQVGNPGHFQDLEALAGEWLPRWQKHFEIPFVRGVALKYVNKLSSQTVPQFATESEIRIDQILTYFADIPVSVATALNATQKRLVPPYDFQINLVLEGVPTVAFSAHLLVPQGNSSKGIDLNFVLTASTEKIDRKVSVEGAMKEFDILHKCLVNAFEALFTERAKTSFEPYDYDAQPRS